MAAGARCQKNHWPLFTKGLPPIDRTDKCLPQAGLPLSEIERTSCLVFTVLFCLSGFTSQSTCIANERPGKPLFKYHFMGYGCLFAIREVSVYNLQHEKFLERVKQTCFYPGTYGRRDGYRTQASYCPMW